MADTNKDNNESQRWRDKYFELTDELETSEQNTRSYLEVLHRALVRISLAAEGQDSDLDKHLTSLRDFLRKEPVDKASINNNLEQVERSILRLENERQGQNPPGFESLRALVEQLSQLNLSTDKKRALKHYNKSLASKGNQLSNYPSLLEEFSRLQREALAESLLNSSPVEPPSPEKKLLSRFFSTKPKPVTAALKDTQTTIEKTSVEESKTTTPETSNADSKSANSDELELTKTKTNEENAQQQENLDAMILVLTDLLEQLPLSAEIRVDAEQLRNHLKELAEAGEWSSVINGTAELVIKALDKNQRDFEQFLLPLDQQLAQINNYLRNQGQSDHARKDSTATLNATVRIQVDSISKVMGEANDITHLKASVQEQLEAIIGSMDQFVISESQREHELEQQLKAMGEHLERVQLEGQEIREKLHNETLRALTDTLTRLPNREAFNERFRLECDRFLRYEHPASIALLDIDHFKQINDNHGHLVGDHILQAFASQVKDMIRSTDFFGRYGGEEFILIMPETTLQSAHAILEKIRISINNLPLQRLGASGAITVSAGLTSFQRGEKAEQLIERTDQALYRAKNEGRNRVVIDHQNS